MRAAARVEYVAPPASTFVTTATNIGAWLIHLNRRQRLFAQLMSRSQAIGSVRESSL